MKLIIALLLLFIPIFSQDEIETTDALDLLLLKIVSQAFMSDYENEKNLTRKNSEAIKSLESAIRELNKKIEELKTLIGKEKIASIGSETITSSNNISSEEARLLKSEIDALKTLLLRLISEKKDSVDKKREIKDEEIVNLKLELIAKVAQVKKEPSIKSNSIKSLQRGAIISVSNCNKYGWCKLKDEDGYVAKYLFSVVSEDNATILE